MYKKIIKDKNITKNLFRGNTLKMDIDEVRNICRNIAKEYGYELDVVVEENEKIRSTLGRVKFEMENGRYCLKKIEFSKELLRGDRDLILDTIKHEMAHFLVLKETGENHKHDNVWKSYALKLGCRPKATVKVDSRDTSKEKYKYIARCKKCGKVVAKYKRLSKVIKKPSNYRSKCCNEKISVGIYDII